MAKSRLPVEEEAAASRQRGARPASKPGASRVVWLGSRLLVFAVLLGALVYCAPLLIGGMGLWKTVLSTAAPALASQITISSLKLAWFSPIEIRGLVVRDPAGQPLAEVPVIRSRKTLLSIAAGSSDVGVFDVEEPRLKIVLRADGSNAEDLLAKLPKSQNSKPSGKPSSVGFGLAVSKGIVDLDDQIAGRKWEIDGLTVDLTWPAGAAQAKTGKLAAGVRPAGADADTGQLSAEFSWQPGADEKSPLGGGQSQIALQTFPTEIAEGGLRRFVSDIRPRGPLTLQAAGGWKENGTIQVLVNQLATPGLSVAAPRLLSTDRPTIAITSGQVAMQLGGGELDVRNVQLTSSIATLGGKASGGLGGDVDLSGQINLVELARQLPATLHIRPDMQLNSGVADIALASRAAGDARRWQGSLKTSNLRGFAAGRVIEFDQPLEVNFDVRQTASGPIIDQLIAQASFLKLEGRGGLADGGITANADLNQLVAELERIIDWGDTRLAGTLAANLRWKHDDATGWTATADAAVQNFEVAAAGLMPWKEPRLHAAANVQGDLAGSSLAQINAAKLLVEAGADRLDAELTQAVKTPSLASIWPAKFTLRGDLASWAPRLQPFVPLGGWRMAGAIDASGVVRVSPKESELDQTAIQVSQLGIDGPSISIHEPIVKIETAGAWSQPKSTLTLGVTTLASSAIAFRADGVRVVLGNEPSLVGTIDFRGDLAKLTSWMAPAQQPPQSQITGAMTGRIEIGYRGQALAANWTSDVANVAYLAAPPPPGPGARSALASAPATTAWQTVWQEPLINIAGQGTFDPAAGAMKIERASIAAATVSLAAAGTLSKLTSSPEVDLSGEIAYDLAVVTREIQSRAKQQAKPGQTGLPYGLDTLQLTGKQKRPFVLKGPLLAATGLTPAGTVPSGQASGGRESPGMNPALAAPNYREADASRSPTPASGGFHIPEALTAEASLGWQGAQYVGLVAGPADFRAKLAGGILQIGPLDIPLAEGRLTTAPRVLLDNRVPAVVFDRGPLLQNVRISPEMCSLWLKFVAPLVAEATRAEGKFSLSLQGADVPLTSPLTSDMAGTLSIQNAQIGPGPLAQQYLGVIRQLRSLFDGAAAAAANDQERGWLVLPQQDVLFEIRDGTVRNRGLKMSVGDLVVTTEGTVEIETQKINLVATIPLHDSWFKRQDGIFAALKGQTLQIPIDGTLTQPRLDTKVLQNLGRQIAGSAVQGVIGKQLERGQGLLNKELQRGEGLIPGELGQGLNRLFGPRQPQPPQPAAPQPPPR